MEKVLGLRKEINEDGEEIVLRGYIDENGELKEEVLY